MKFAMRLVMGAAILCVVSVSGSSVKFIASHIGGEPVGATDASVCSAASKWMSSRRTLVEFSKPTRLSTYKEEKNHQGKQKCREYWSRPDWAVMHRCSSTRRESCQACTTKTADCWGNYRGEQDVGVRASKAKWKAHFMTIHVRCQTGDINIVFKVKRLRRGELRVFWDGVQQGSTVMSDKALDKVKIEDKGTRKLSTNNHRTVALKIPIARAGGHTFVIQFLPDAIDSTYKDPLVIVRNVRFFLAPEYAKCENEKACLHKLHEAGAAGMLLRSSPALQGECLAGEAVAKGPACQSWRSCLAPEFKASLSNMIGAAGFSAPGTLTQVNVSSSSETSIVRSVGGLASSRREAQAFCINPATEDPESWACDCYEEAVARCSTIEDLPSYSLQSCLRASYCMHPSVCKSWLDAYCTPVAPDGAVIVNMMQELAKRAASQAPGTGLLTQRAFLKRADSTVDASFRQKVCV